MLIEKIGSTINATRSRDNQPHKMNRVYPMPDVSKVTDTKSALKAIGDWIEALSQVAASGTVAGQFANGKEFTLPADKVMPSPFDTLTIQSPADAARAVITWLERGFRLHHQQIMGTALTKKWVDSEPGKGRTRDDAVEVEEIG